MATYVYETIPSSPDQPVKQFEMQQSMRDAALTTHPETGEPVRRVISGGFGYLGGSRSDSTPLPAPQASHGGGCGHGGCGCHH
jgi:predicted nucleic acid-binding Zn ribbon protein